MKQKSPYYICDCCGQKITDLSEAALEWQQPSMKPAINFKIVHRMCLKEVPHLADRDFGDNYEGIVMLILEKLSDNCVSNPEDAYEILKRLTITDYELVRPYLDLAIEEGVIELNSKERYPHYRQIQTIKEHYLEKKG